MPDVDLLLSEVKSYSSQRAIKDLLEAGVDANFLDDMVGIFKDGILTKTNVDDLLEQLQEYVVGGEGKLGRLERYVKQVHSDTVTQYVASYSQVLTEDLGLEFYMYVGNVQDDTRCFCKERVGKYYHIKEIEAWGRGENLGDCGVDWKGKIAGTNASNILINRGGWNCEHQFVAVSTYDVPEDVIQRNIDNGNFDPENF